MTTFNSLKFHFALNNYNNFASDLTRLRTVSETATWKMH